MRLPYNLSLVTCHSSLVTRHFLYVWQHRSTMQQLLKLFAMRWSAFLDRLLVRRIAGGVVFGPLFIDRGRGLLYDVERDLTWLQDTNYAKTTARSPDGQMTWD